MSLHYNTLTILYLNDKRIWKDLNSFKPFLKGVQFTLSRDNSNLTKTCLRIDATTWKEFKIMCINQGISANEMLTTLVEEKLEKYNKTNG